MLGFIKEREIGSKRMDCWLGRNCKSGGTAALSAREQINPRFRWNFPSFLSSCSVVSGYLVVGFTLQSY